MERAIMLTQGSAALMSRATDFASTRVTLRHFGMYAVCLCWVCLTSSSKLMCSYSCLLELANTAMQPPAQELMCSICSMFSHMLMHIPTPCFLHTTSMSASTDSGSATGTHCVVRVEHAAEMPEPRFLAQLPAQTCALTCSSCCRCLVT